MSREKNNTLKDDLVEAGIDISANYNKLKENTKHVLITAIAVVLTTGVILAGTALVEYSKNSSKVECVKHATDESVCVEMFKR